MLQLTINKQELKAHVSFDGKDQVLNLVKVNKENTKPGTYWVNLQPLGCARKWFTVKFFEHEEEVFVVDVDETSARVVTPRVSRIISLGNIKDFLDDADAAMFDELRAKAEAEAKRRADEAEANKPVKEKKSRKMTPAEILAKKKAEIMELEETLKKIESGELPADYLDKKSTKKAKKIKATVLEDLDEQTTIDTNVVTEGL